MKSNLVHLAYRNAKQEADTRRLGVELRKHLIEHICRVMLEYAPDVGVDKEEIVDDLKAIRAWKLDAITDWYYVYDALASCGNLDTDLREFCDYARSRWYYSQLPRRANTR